MNSPSIRLLFLTASANVSVVSAAAGLAGAATWAPVEQPAATRAARRSESERIMGEGAGATKG